SKLTGNEYQLQYQDGDYVLTNLQTNERQIVTPDAEGKLNVDGFSLSLNGTPQNNDRMLIRPTRQGASDVSAILTKPEELAASSQFTTTANQDNTGEARLQVQMTAANGSDLP